MKTVRLLCYRFLSNNCPVCMTDLLNVRLRATEIRFALIVKRRKTSDVVY